MRLIHNIFELGDRRRELRQNATPQEILVWEKLRNRKIGLKFKRQYSIGGYILDFYCAEKRFIVEIDGGIHKTKEAREYDAVRDKYFEELDYKTLRITNDEVENNIDKVIEKIKFYS
jgi:very-short-patch-repair endonuclease